MHQVNAVAQRSEEFCCTRFQEAEEVVAVYKEEEDGERDAVLYESNTACIVLDRREQVRVSARRPSMDALRVPIEGICRRHAPPRYRT